MTLSKSILNTRSITPFLVFCCFYFSIYLSLFHLYLSCFLYSFLLFFLLFPFFFLSFYLRFNYTHYNILSLLNSYALFVTTPQPVKERTRSTRVGVGLKMVAFSPSLTDIFCLPEQNQNCDSPAGRRDSLLAVCHLCLVMCGKWEKHLINKQDIIGTRGITSLKHCI